MLCDHETQEHCDRDQREEDCGEDNKGAKVPGMKLLFVAIIQNINNNTLKS